MKWIGTDNERIVKESLLRYIPYFYTDSPVVNGILDTDAEEIEKYYENIEDVLNQYFFTTATWGLERWEKFLGLPAGGDLNDEESVRERRAAIQSALQGFGVCTVDKLKDICSFYSGGEVEVTEKNSTYTVSIAFTGSAGIPTNMGVLMRIVRTMLPAHIAVEYVYTFTTYNGIEGMTWNQLEAMGTWDDIEGAALV